MVKTAPLMAKDTLEEMDHDKMGNNDQTAVCNFSEEEHDSIFEGILQDMEQ